MVVFPYSERTKASSPTRNGSVSGLAVLALSLSVARGSAGAAGGPAGMPGLSAEGVLKQAWHSDCRVRDIRCKVSVIVSFSLEHPVLLVADYLAKPPDKAKFVVSSRTGRLGARDSLRYGVGLAYGLTSTKLGTFYPFAGKTERWDLSGPSAPALMSGHSTTRGAAQITHYLAAYDYLRLCTGATPVLSGRPSPEQGQATIELPFKLPVSSWAGHQCVKARLTVDTTRFVVLEAKLLDEGGKPARTTKFLDFREVRDGRWVPLRSETVTAPGTFVVQHKILVRRGDGPRQETFLKTPVSLPGWRVIREFEWLDGRVLVPRQVEVWTTEGKPRFKAVFSHYELDTGIPDSAFGDQATPAAKVP